MIREIMRDEAFLTQPSEAAVPEDLPTAQDLLDTLAAHQAGCVGMAANMIGYKKRIIIVSMGFVDLVMQNPVIKAKSGKYETEESCLSLTGRRRTGRYQNIEVEYLDVSFKRQRQKFSGYVAQIIQHEMDHLEGIVI